ncbi:hypothetical protein AB0K80_17480 [Streptomyces sp. NPDC052682]|uniref:hypothetical protein n=1 Tax=Streptomyces sp. NPDC052682 TaxID=3154954 RepID=UPI00343001F4
MNRIINRCTAGAALATAVLATLAWATPAQAADRPAQETAASTQDFTWQPPSPIGALAPVTGQLPHLPGLPGDFTWSPLPAHGPEDFTWSPLPEDHRGDSR